MIHVKPGNLIAVSAEGRYYYALVLKSLMPRINGHWCFIFHKTSEDLLSAPDLLTEGASGFYELVDFIWAKRQNRLIRIAEKINLKSYNDIRCPNPPLCECVNDRGVIERLRQYWSAEVDRRAKSSAGKFPDKGACLQRVTGRALAFNRPGKSV